jgi:hypothetical protein
MEDDTFIKTVKRRRNEEKKDNTKENVKRSHSGEILCQKFLANIKPCEELSNPRRLLETRSACMYQFLKKLYGRENTYSTDMTLPFILSFDRDSRFCAKAIDLICQELCQDDESEFPKRVKVSTNLLECNKVWNKVMQKQGTYEFIADNIDIEIATDNPKFNETIDTLRFYTEVIGILNRKAYEEQQPYYVDSKTASLVKINAKIDKKCKAYSENLCEEDKDCILRETSKGGKSCMNAQRIRTFEPNKATTYYIFERPFVENKYYVYRCLAKRHIIAGTAGIFSRYKVTASKNIKPDNTITITFPPLADDSYYQHFIAFYLEARLELVEAKPSGNAPKMEVGISNGMLEKITEWYNIDFSPLNIDSNIPIIIQGVSLGGALANVAAFILIQNGYTNIHMYAYGAPRVGDERFVYYMEKAGLQPDSANYIRFNNVIKNDTFYTQFDPATKFPPNTWSLSMPGAYRFVDNPLIKCMGAGLIFNSVFQMLSTQSDYDMVPGAHVRRLYLNNINDATPVGAGNCDNLWKYVHSTNAYDSEIFIGRKLYWNDDKRIYSECFDRIIDLNIEKCIPRLAIKIKGYDTEIGGDE